MPRGSKPGERRGGRVLGTPNKATMEKNRVAAEIAARTVVEAKASGRKLGKEVLDEFMHLFADMAMALKPKSATAKRLNPKFFEFSRLAIDTAYKLARYQSPTYQAVAVIAPPANQQQQLQGPSNVISIDDPDALARVYRLRVGGVKG